MLYTKNYAPARSFDSVAEFEEYFRKYDMLIIDGTEQRIERPSDEDSQKDNYSDGPPLR
jgi:chromosomal replication initiation ATPase DnaA